MVMSTRIVPLKKTLDLAARMREANPFGVHLYEDGTARFRLWMPSQQAKMEQGLFEGPKLWLPKQDEIIDMVCYGGGWFEARAENIKHGDPYMFDIYDDFMKEGQMTKIADPAGLWQMREADTPLLYSPSLVVDPARVKAKLKTPWKTPPLYNLVLEEIHIGSASPEGTFEALKKQLPYYAESGINGLSLMPVEAASSRFGWGYEGTLKHAIQPEYGDPEAVAEFVDAAHQHGITVLIDIVDNHFGPEANWAWMYEPEFMAFKDPAKPNEGAKEGFDTPWGPAINFERKTVRKYFLQRSRAMLDLYGFDGFRKDAVHAIVDPLHQNRPKQIRHFLTEQAAKSFQINSKSIHILENEHDQASFLDPDSNRATHDFRGHAQWGDNFHHALRLLVAPEKFTQQIQYYFPHALTLLSLFNAASGNKESYLPVSLSMAALKDMPRLALSYYLPYAGNPLSCLAETLKTGYAFSLESSQRLDHTTAQDRQAANDPRKVVFFTQNHDQIGNTAGGKRLETLLENDPYRDEKLKFMATLVLSTPATPMLFMGQELGLKTPFPFCASRDNPNDAKAIEDGRAWEFPYEADINCLPPSDPASFETSKIPVPDPEALKHNPIYQHYINLIANRHAHIIPHLKSGIAESKVDIIDDQVIETEWTFGNGARLALKLNPSDRPFTSSDHQTKLGPWQIEVYTDPAPQPAQHSTLKQAPTPLG